MEYICTANQIQDAFNRFLVRRIAYLRKQISEEGVSINGKPHPAFLELPKLMKKAGVRFPDFMLSRAADVHGAQTQDLK